MIVRIYAIYDAQLASYAQPFFAQTHGHAIRMFGDHCKDPSTTPHKHPADFALYHLGEFNDQSGELTSRTKPERISGALEHLEDEPATKQLDITEAINRSKNARTK